MTIKTEKPNLEKITKEGFSYIKRYYFDQSLEIYAKDDKRVIYNPESDSVVMYTEYVEGR